MNIRSSFTRSMVPHATRDERTLERERMQYSFASTINMKDEMEFSFETMSCWGGKVESRNYRLRAGVRAR